MTVLLYRTASGPFARIDGETYSVGPANWDELLNTDDLANHLRRQAIPANAAELPSHLLAPVMSQEVWGAGVTYYRSRNARMAESKEAGGGSFYDRVYEAVRPEIFFKATAQRVADPGGVLRIRRDSNWMVPEPELTLVINHRHRIIGYTVGNDLSCRDIEGENPLYLPQAKTFDGCVALGPGLLIQDEFLPPETRIELEIRRGGAVVNSDATTLSELKRKPEYLVEYLTRETRFPLGCFLLTGTGIVPDDHFRLMPGDEVRITIAPIGTLVNTMA